MKIAVVGLGFMGSTHLKAWRSVGGAELAAVVSDSPAKLEGDLSTIQGNIGGPGEWFDFSGVRKYRKVEEALADPEIEAVDLCNPTHLHAPVTIRALEAGKHVLVEKPMALDGEEADRMLAAARQSGRLLMVAQVLRFWADYQPLIERCDSGRLGTVRSALFRRRCAAPGWGKWLKDRDQGGGGVFDLLIHDVDLCISLFGMPEAVSATGYEDMAAGIDLVTANLHYAGIGSVIVTGGWHHPQAYPFSMEYTVSGDGGTIEYSSAGRPVTLYRPDGEAETLSVPAQDGFAGELGYFLDCAMNSRRPDRCDPSESAAAVRLTRAMADARQNQGEKIACKL